ncbi:MAG TPA: quinol:electron acceptor oxidoreductase subunit ActD [Bryobacteraceae bacterium]|nr:quinol:electron acceptor oxidoreductase subunit ActD [Bryobacteraceae bacterium]
MYLAARFDDEDLVAPACLALLEAGFPARAIEVFSQRPVRLPQSFAPRPSRMPLIAVLAAVVNGGLATAFMFYTQRDYPIVTGGMPLRSWWATGVITYELTMAGAVAGLVLGFLWESGLLRRRRAAAPAPGEHAVILRLECSPEDGAAVTVRLRQLGARDVRPLEEAE